MISVESQDHIAKLIYRKVPNNSELNRMFKDQTKEVIILTNNKDVILGCLNRYADVIQQTRAIHDKAVAHRIANNSFYSGATIERQSATSSSNTTISYGTTNATATTVKDPKRSLKPMPHDTDFHEGNRKVSNRCERCGMTNHLRRDCLLYGNKMCNNTSTLWHFSPIGRATHEPWKQLKDNVILHEFLISKNLKHNIPRKYIPSTNASSKTNETADDSEN